MLIMKKILSVVGIIGGTFFLLVAAICVEEWFSNPAYAADMEISGLIMCIVLGIFGVILIVLGIQTLRLQKLYREYKEIAETSNDGFIPDMAAILNQPEDKVRRNLEKLCKKKYFNDAYVDNKAKLFVRKDQMSQKIGNPSFTKTVKQTDAELVHADQGYLRFQCIVEHRGKPEADNQRKDDTNQSNHNTVLQ